MIKLENEQKDKSQDDSMENQAKKQNLNLNLNKFSRISISNTLNKYISKEDLNEFPKKIKIRTKFNSLSQKQLKQEKENKKENDNPLKRSMKKDPQKNVNENGSLYHFDATSELRSDITHVSNLEFFINNNRKNSEFKLKNNKITTTKYNIITFLPKGLLYQFSRLANVYFLFITIIQSIPIISPLNSLTAIIPLIFVLGVSMIRELIEDLSRHKYDKISNNEEVMVLRENKFVPIQSKLLKCGEIVLIYENEHIPADLVILDSGIGDGKCYVETSTLDGEKALKLKIANTKIAGLITNRIKKNINYKNLKLHKIKDLISFEINGFIQVIPPNANLNQIDGRLNIFVMENNLVTKEESFQINIKEFILKGSVLKSTNWIIGVVIYTGMDNKIILNSKKPRLKISHLEIKLNYCLIGVFIFLVISSILYSYYHYYLYKKHNKYYSNFVPLDKNITTDCIINFFTYFLLFNTLIPISLIVTIEIIKMIQGLFIHWDTELYSKSQHCFCKARTVSINEELGKVNFIFSDKTGTLTQNKLNFKYCIIGNKLYKNFGIPSEFKKRTSQITNMSKYQQKVNKFQSIAKRVDEGYLADYIKKCKEKIQECEDNGKVELLNKIFLDKKQMEEDINYITEFLFALSLDNECMVDNHDNDNNDNSFDSVKYVATSPDDLELVKFAAKQGFKLIQTSFDEKVVLVGRKKIKFKILQMLNFSSERKRMSILVEDPKGIIKIYTKGADMEITRRLSHKSRYSENYKTTMHDIESISNLGYRALMVAYREIEKKEYLKWKEKFHTEDLNEGKNNKIIERSYEAIEKNFELLGATIVEDKLQDQVPETIKQLKYAKIKFWVLTGDKMNTAVNIGYSCNLISKEQQIFKLQLEKDKNLNVNFESNYLINKFFSDFNSYLKKLAEKYNIIPDNSPKSRRRNSVILDNPDISSNSESVSDENINLALYKTLEQKKYNESYSIIIEAPILISLFQDEDQTEKFLSICYNSNSVLCCRVSPFQKSQIVQKMKQFSPDSVTLAIGDGSNDVAMIMEANVGIGILGEEGMSASKASDFAIGEFKLLKRLLFFHGRTNLSRISHLILYFFYKNIIFTLSQLFFGPFSLLSGQTIIDDWYITCYNLIFTAIPLSVAALTDVDVEEEDLKGKDMPLLYKESRDEKIIFRRRSFLWTAIRGAIVSLIMFVICVNNEVLSKRGHMADLWYLSLLYYLSILFVVTNNLFFITHYIVNLLFVSVIITTFLFLVVFLVLVHYGLLFDFKSKATIIPSIENLSFYVYLFFSLGFNFVLDYTLKIRHFFFDKHLSTELFRQKTINDRKRKKELRHNKSQKTVFNNEISRINLINKNSILQGFNINKENEQRISYFNKTNLSKINSIRRNDSKLPDKSYNNKNDKISSEESSYS